MQSLTIKKRSHTKILLPILIAVQVAFLAGTYASAGTQVLWIWATLSFIPATVMCLSGFSEKWVLSSLVLLFVSQQSIFVFANPSWGFSYGSDPINDFHITQVLSGTSHFTLGQVGYASRIAYSYYPMLHLFTVVLSSVSSLPLMSVAMYFVPTLNAVLTTIALFYVNQDLFGLKGRERNLATLLFEMSFYYTSFDSQFVRESFAFPLALLSFWIFAKMVKSRSRAYAVLAPIVIVCVILSHHITSYILLVVLALMAAGFSVFHNNNRLRIVLILTAVSLGIFTTFVALPYSASILTYTVEGIQAIFHREGSVTIMRPYSSSLVYLAFLQYAILAVFVFVGGLSLFREKKKDWARLVLIGFFVFAFVLSMAIRLSTSADVWSWTYYMGLRGTIWGFMGISVVFAVGIVYILRLNAAHARAHASLMGLFVLLFVICLSAVGKFSQFPSIVTDSSKMPVTYDRYVAALWLRESSTHGLRILVAPYAVSVDAFEASREMAPYAYLKEYFLEETIGVTYDKFYGYIPFVGKFFDLYKNSTGVQIIYSNGKSDIGYKQR